MRTPAAFCVLLISVLKLGSQTSDRYETEQGFVVHEWGTFTTLHTSVGRQLAGLHIEEVPLPPFVYNVGNTYRHPDKYYTKGVHITDISSLANVNVKMETPVLYFYNPASEKVNISLDVKFMGGSVTQWYPIGSAQNLQINLSHSGPYTEDYSIPHTGFVKWKAEIAPHGEQRIFSNNKLQETKQWVAPRATESDFVTAKMPTYTGPATYDTVRQTEKFLFYRGIGNFMSALKAEFNTKGNIVLTNRRRLDIPYILIFEKTENGDKIAWWHGTLDASRRTVFQYSNSETTLNTKTAMEAFKAALVKAGLYADEAAAMLDTWNTSYFEHPGLKIFWILPPKLVDEILPLQIDPAPQTLKRVLVGRIEIMTPSFEAEIKTMQKAEFEQRFSDDRFYAAFQDLRNSNFYSSLTEFDSLPLPAEQDRIRAENSLAIFPNPFSNVIDLALSEDSERAEVLITNILGEMVYSTSFIGTTQRMDLSSFPAGVYYIQAILPGGVRLEKKLLKN